MAAYSASSAKWQHFLRRWQEAGLIDEKTAAAIAVHETAHEAGQEAARGWNWQVIVALTFGGVLLAAGILLFVAAHWDTMSPAWRFSLVLAMVAALHIGGALVATRFPALSITLHAVGTICLGAGIFLAGQIFHLQEHWPGGVLLWALGAWAAWALLRDWPQAALAAVLTPAWLIGEWIEAVPGRQWDMPATTFSQVSWTWATPAVAALMLAITYLSAVTPEKTSAARKALVWIGGAAFIPAVIILETFVRWRWSKTPFPEPYATLCLIAAYLLPLLLAWCLRGKRAWVNVIAMLWIFLLVAVTPASEEFSLALFLLCAVGALGLIQWGLTEGRQAMINLGLAGFALNVLWFYFSNVFDKLGRSLSLIGLGILFLVGGWLLEKTRRRLMVKIGGGEL